MLYLNPALGGGFCIWCIAYSQDSCITILLDIELLVTVSTTWCAVLRTLCFTRDFLISLTRDITLYTPMSHWCTLLVILSILVIMKNSWECGIWEQDSCFIFSHSLPFTLQKGYFVFSNFEKHITKDCMMKMDVVCLFLVNNNCKSWSKINGQVMHFNGANLHTIYWLREKHSCSYNIIAPYANDGYELTEQFSDTFRVRSRKNFALSFWSSFINFCQIRVEFFD